MLVTPITEDQGSNFNIFLAGSIQGVHDWQSKFAKEFEDYQDVAFLVLEGISSKNLTIMNTFKSIVVHRNRIR